MVNAFLFCTCLVYYCGHWAVLHCVRGGGCGGWSYYRALTYFALTCSKQIAERVDHQCNTYRGALRPACVVLFSREASGYAKQGWLCSCDGLQKRVLGSGREGRVRGRPLDRQRETCMGEDVELGSLSTHFPFALVERLRGAGGWGIGWWGRCNGRLGWSVWNEFVSRGLLGCFPCLTAVTRMPAGAGVRWAVALT